MSSIPVVKDENFLREVQEFRRKRVSRLRNINHWWNITLTVAGITLTAITTVLGVIDSQEYKDWIKFGIALSGSVAVLSQSANKEFRVKGKAGKYAQENQAFTPFSSLHLSIYELFREYFHNRGNAQSGIETT